MTQDIYIDEYAADPQVISASAITADAHSSVNGGSLLPRKAGLNARGISGWLGSLRGCAHNFAKLLHHINTAAGQTEDWGGCSANTLASGAAASSTGPIRVWIVGATGFRQGLGRPTGLEGLWLQLRELAAPDVCVLTPMTWDSDPVALAEYIARNSAPGAVVFFYGYSYGVGHFGVRFWAALNALHIPVPMAVSCDGIRRKRLLKPLSLRWFSALVSIPVPANVREVYAFRQSEDKLLRGHRLVPEDAGFTTVYDCPLRGYDHIDIDESPSFHRVALTEARNLITQR